MITFLINVVLTVATAVAVFVATLGAVAAGAVLVAVVRDFLRGGRRE